MRTICRASLLTAVVFGVAGWVRAEDQPEARAVVEKAIKAMGRDTKAAQQKAINWKGKGKFFGFGEGLEFSGEWWAQTPYQQRGDFEIDFMGNKLKMTRCLDGDKGWLKTADGVMEMEKDELAEEKHSVYTTWVALLYPLTDKAFELSLLGESKVEGRPVVGVRVARKGERDVSLYIDKEKYNLLKTETRIKDVMGGGVELTQDVFYNEYKDRDGVKEFQKYTVKRDGKLLVEFEFTEFKRIEKLDDSVFKQ